jgi:hypothetical protein
MSAAGGVVYLGKVLDWIAKDLKRIVSRLAKPLPGEAPARLDDIPFIIKTLTFEEEEMRAEARAALKALAGKDLGPEPGPWTEWWNTRGQELLRLRRDEERIEQLFWRLKAAILTGKWDAAVSLVSESERRTDGPEGGAGWLRAHKKEVRQAYRDACIRDLEIENEGKGPLARLTVNWGVLGYEHRDVLVEHSGDDWRFASEPWGGHLVEQPKRPARARKVKHHVKLRPEEFYATGALAVGVVCVASIPLVLIYLPPSASSRPGPYWRHLAWASSSRHSQWASWYGR